MSDILDDDIDGDQDHEDEVLKAIDEHLSAQDKERLEQGGQVELKLSSFGPTAREYFDSLSGEGRALDGLVGEIFTETTTGAAAGGIAGGVTGTPVIAGAAIGGATSLATTAVKRMTRAVNSTEYPTVAVLRERFANRLVKHAVVDAARVRVFFMSPGSRQPEELVDSTFRTRLWPHIVPSNLPSIYGRVLWAVYDGTDFLAEAVFEGSGLEKVRLTVLERKPH